jgi:hypothetical protein|tara:strand:- start:543 stop:800 length:258 start_codon:yes stop_codon:yes gene_type:complete
MEEKHIKALKCMVFAQSFVEALDDFGGTTAFKRQLKNKGNSFVKEVDAFLNSTYQNGSTDSSLIGLIESCQNAIDKIIDEDVTVI